MPDHFSKIALLLAIALAAAIELATFVMSPWRAASQVVASSTIRSAVPISGRRDARGGMAMTRSVE